MSSRSEVKVSWSNSELSYISLFESATNTRVIDCLISDDDKTVFFLLKPQDAEKIRRNCKILIQHLTRTMGKGVHVFEFHDDLELFLRKALHPVEVLSIQIGEFAKGGKAAYITVSDIDKGRAIGKNGFRIQGIREIVKRYFELSDVKIR